MKFWEIQVAVAMNDHLKVNGRDPQEIWVSPAIWDALRAEAQGHPLSPMQQRVTGPAGEWTFMGIPIKRDPVQLRVRCLTERELRK